MIMIMLMKDRVGRSESGRWSNILTRWDDINNDNVIKVECKVSKV